MAFFLGDRDNQEKDIWGPLKALISREIVRRDPLQHFFGVRGPKIDKVRAFFVRYFLGPLGIP